MSFRVCEKTSDVRRLAEEICFSEHLYLMLLSNALGETTVQTWGDSLGTSPSRDKRELLIKDQVIQGGVRAIMWRL